MTPDGIAQLKRDEGLRLRPYRCTSGKLTIGYGRNLEDRGIDRHEADAMLQNDIERTETSLSHHVIWPSLSDVRRDVLINMAYNMGLDGLYKFNRFFQRLAMRDYSRAADEMLDSAWAQQVGDRAKRLAEIMRSGVQNDKA